MPKYPGTKRLSDGRYLVRVKARNPKTGMMLDVRREVEAASAAEAFQIRESLRCEVERTGGEVRARPRFAECVISWMRTKLPSLKASSRRHLADTLDLNILPTLGDYFLDAITHDDVVAWRDAQAVLRVGRGREKHLIAPETVNTRLRVLRQVLGDLCDQHHLPDPTRRVPGVRVRRRRDPKGLEAHELYAVLAQLRVLSPQWYALTFTLVLTAGRWGEVTALKWEHIDEQRRVIVFEQAHVRGAVDDTKTEITKETPLVPELIAALREHRRALVERQAPGLDQGWVFPSTRGTLMQSSALRGPLARACAAAGVRRISPHGLRYTFNRAAKRVASADVVRSITGHVTEEMTRHYDWIVDDEKHAAVAEVHRLFTTAPTPPALPAGGTGGGIQGDGNGTAG